MGSVVMATLEQFTFYSVDYILSFDVELFANAGVPEIILFDQQNMYKLGCGWNI